MPTKRTVLSMNQILKRKKEIEDAFRVAGLSWDPITCITLVLIGQGLEERGFIVQAPTMGPESKLVH